MIASLLQAGFKLAQVECDGRSDQSANAVQGLRTIPEETSVAAAEGTITQAASVSLFRISLIQRSNGMEVDEE